MCAVEPLLCPTIMRDGSLNLGGRSAVDLLVVAKCFFSVKPFSYLSRLALQRFWRNVESDVAKPWHLLHYSRESLSRRVVNAVVVLHLVQNVFE